MDHWAIDVSRWQQTIDWQKVKDSGVEAAWIKVGGNDAGKYRDSMAQRNMDEAGKVGLPYGTYYFAVPQVGSAEDVATHAVGCGYGAGKLWPALDLERNDYRLSGSQLDDWCVAFCAQVMELTGRESILYTGVNVGVGQTQRDFPSCPLWIANYGLNKPNTEPPGGWSPAVPRAWSETGWSVWQFNSVTTIPGISGNVDQNVVTGEFWNQMLGGEEYDTNGDDDMTTPTGIVRTKVGSEWALENIGVNDVSVYLLTIEGTRTVRPLTPESLAAELFWTNTNIEDVWEVDDSFLTGGRYELDSTVGETGPVGPVGPPGPSSGGHGTFMGTYMAEDDGGEDGGGGGYEADEP